MAPLPKEQSRSSGFRDIDSVHGNPLCPAKPATKGNRSKAILGRVEAVAVLNLYAGLQLSQIQEVPSVQGELLNLLPVKNTLYGCLHCIHLHVLAVTSISVVAVPTPSFMSPFAAFPT
jgi:hypothetical protein